jgi:hypothetical protein
MTLRSKYYIRHHFLKVYISVLLFVCLLNGPDGFLIDHFKDTIISNDLEI